jgi:peptidoglycan/LPS O-acetylase OafA/YrhL
MKRTVIMIIVALLVIISVIIWLTNSESKIELLGIVMIASLVLVVGFAISFIIQRIRSSSRNETPEDELSKKIMTKTSSLSFYISLYLWLAISYFGDRIELETSSIINAGILGMAIVFLLSWVGVKLFGFKNG